VQSSLSAQTNHTGRSSGQQEGSNTNERNLTYNQQSSSEPSTDHEDHRELEKHLVKLIDEDELDQREIQRGVRAIYVGHDVSNISFLIRQQRGKDGDEYHFAGNDIPKRHLKTGHDELFKDALSLPEQSLADELVEAFFTHVNPGYPIVDEDMFMTQYRNRDPADPPPIIILQAILLVGAHVSRPKAERDALKVAFFRRCKWLFDARIERNRDILVQVALLLTWHSDSTDDDVSANAYYWVGVAARLATGIGMHRNPVSSSFSAEDRRTWRRVWWILVQFDVMVSLSYGRPQAM
jgi:transcriptional regulatory protein AMDR